MADPKLIEELRDAGVDKPDEVADAVAPIAEYMDVEGWKKAKNSKLFVEPKREKRGAQETRLQRISRYVGAIKSVVAAFSEEGLTLQNYMNKAVLKQSSLFIEDPDKIENNIRAVVSAFEKEGLTVEGYLQAALKKPSLFSQAPETIIRHGKNLLAYKEMGLLDTDKRGVEQNFGEWLHKYSALLTNSDTHIASRMLLAELSEKPMTGPIIKKLNNEAAALGLVERLDDEALDHYGRTHIQRLADNGMITKEALEKQGAELGTWKNRVERAQERKDNKEQEAER